MKSVATRTSKGPANPMRILLIWTLVSGLLFGLAEFGAPLDDVFRVARNKFREHDASGQVVVVGIDSAAQQELGDWPWPADRYARMVEQLGNAGARNIYFDFPLNVSKDDVHLKLLASTMAKLDGKVHIAANFAPETAENEKTQLLPLPQLRNVTSLINTNVRTNGFNTVWTVPYSNRVAGIPVPSLASAVSDETGGAAEAFPIDYSINMDSLPYISAAQVLRSNASIPAVKNRDVVIGTNATGIGNRYAVPGNRPAASVFVSALAAETLLAQRPVQYGWWWPFAIALGVCALMLRVSRSRLVLGMLILLPICSIGLPLALESLGYFTSIMPATILMLGSMGHLAWRLHRQRYDERGMINEVSGQPNLNALRALGTDSQDGLIAARIHNYAEAATALPAAAEKELVDQIIMRLSLGNGGCKVYQGDEGIFMWLIPASSINNVGDQLAGLSAIFRSPANISGRLIDLGIAFGVDADPGRSIQSRMSSALLACQEAQNAGEHWRVYDPTKLEATEWRVTMLGELDAAIDNGEVWVAFQPKLDLLSGEICGAEALVRWTHPEKGPINPEEFITAAERHDRIEKLTEHVLNRAVQVASRLNRDGRKFDMAVNLSPRLIGHANLKPMVIQTLRRHGLAAERLILEITETAAMSSAEAAMQELRDLRSIGLQLSIDDYGTGFSTLDYLKRCPATELKIDRSFVRMLVSSRSDRIMVNSTIELAHSLGEEVVAEGVEDNETLQLLGQMGCDKAQGYLIARPMPYEALIDYLANYSSAKAA
ncbi:EAL domain-containing protein [Blastomonas sp. AAP53]|uniref:EAL domain-containing protein n=1 Tax=Blastomonas sp. AAP53 TaxID=1248760 RepID=UPI00036EA7BE|nr:EAL domain-containing protein [Blastomonas sp. AAP53]